MYFLPSIVAFARNKRDTAAIVLLNFFLGWTMIGWVVALVWAVKTDVSDGSAVSSSVSASVARKPASYASSDFVSDDELLAPACSRQNPPPPPDAATLLQSVPPPIRRSTRPRRKRHWSNPYLVIRADAVGLLTGSPPMKNRY